MKKCQNPLCGKELPPWKDKFCTSSCRNAVAQRNFRARQGKPPVPVREMFKKKPVTGTANVERLKNRSLMIQEKSVIAAVQTPPPASPELKKATAERDRRQAEVRRIAEEKTRSLVAQERSVQNLRAVYFCGTTLKMLSYLQRRRHSTSQRIEEQNPGMFLRALYDDYDEWTGTYLDERKYAQAFLERELDPDWPKCGHGKSWREECELCDNEIPLHEFEEKQAQLIALQTEARGLSDSALLENEKRRKELEKELIKKGSAVLAKLGYSVWAGVQSAYEGHYGHGRTVEGIEARSHNPRPYRKGTKPDSFEKTGEEAPVDSGQVDSQPDLNYAGKKFGLGKAANEQLEGSDNPNAQQADAKQDLVTGEGLFLQDRAEENREERILNEAHEKINEWTSDREVDRIMEKARRKINSGEDAPGERLPEETSEEPEAEVADENDPPTSEAA